MSAIEQRKAIRAAEESADQVTNQRSFAKANYHASSAAEESECISSQSEKQAR